MTDVILRPDADGTAAPIEWFSVDATRYDKINDESDLTKIYTSDVSTAQHHSRFTKPASGIPVGATINSVKLTLRCRRIYDANPTIPYISHGLYIGAVEYHGANVNVTTDAYTDYSKTWLLSPATGLSFTIAEIDAMELCFTGNSNRKFVLGAWWYTNIFCSEAYLTVSYTEAAPSLGKGVSGSVLTIATCILKRIAEIRRRRKFILFD